MDQQRQEDQPMDVEGDFDDRPYFDLQETQLISLAGLRGSNGTGTSYWLFWLHCDQ